MIALYFDLWYTFIYYIFAKGSRLGGHPTGSALLKWCGIAAEPRLLEALLSGKQIIFFFLSLRYFTPHISLYFSQ